MGVQSIDNIKQNLDCDVAICGGGLTGLSTSILLSRLNLSVICIEPKQKSYGKVGESFDWSTPELLKSIGIDMSDLVDKGHAVPKNTVSIAGEDGRMVTGGPKKWLKNKPFNLETVSHHSDRSELDKLLYELAKKEGVTFIDAKVKDVQSVDRKVVSFDLNNNQSIRGKWFIDASGRAQVMGRTLKLKKSNLGPKKVALWTSFQASQTKHGTTLYGNTKDEYLTWCWRFPIRPDTVSLGCVSPAELIERKVKSGYSIKEIFFEQLKRYPNLFKSISIERNPQIQTTTYRPYVFQKVSGQNWIITGEAAALHDAITSNGVTNGLRHAHDVVRIIDKSIIQNKKVRHLLRQYNSKVQWMSRFLNFGAEHIVYRKQQRRMSNIRFAGRFYARVAFLVNVIYTKIKPNNEFKLLLFKLILTLFFGLWLALIIPGKFIYGLVNLFKSQKKNDSNLLRKQT